MSLSFVLLTSSCTKTLKLSLDPSPSSWTTPATQVRSSQINPATTGCFNASTLPLLRSEYRTSRGTSRLSQRSRGSRHQADTPRTLSLCSHSSQSRSSTRSSIGTLVPTTTTGVALRGRTVGLIGNPSTRTLTVTILSTQSSIQKALSFCLLTLILSKPRTESRLNTSTLLRLLQLSSSRLVSLIRSSQTGTTGSQLTVLVSSLVQITVVDLINLLSQRLMIDHELLAVGTIPTRQTLQSSSRTKVPTDHRTSGIGRHTIASTLLDLNDLLHDILSSSTIKPMRLDKGLSHDSRIVILILGLGIDTHDAVLITVLSNTPLDLTSGSRHTSTVVSQLRTQRLSRIGVVQIHTRILRLVAVHQLTSSHVAKMRIGVDHLGIEKRSYRSIGVGTQDLRSITTSKEVCKATSSCVVRKTSSTKSLAVVFAQNVNGRQRQTTIAT